MISQVLTEIFPVRLAASLSARAHKKLPFSSFPTLGSDLEKKKKKVQLLLFIIATDFGFTVGLSVP